MKHQRKRHPNTVTTSNTDVIIPARYLNMYTMEELAAHCMEDLGSPPFWARVKQGDIIVGGTNFGCGSIARAGAHGH